MSQNGNAQMLTMAEAAELMGVDISTIKWWSNEGILKLYRYVPGNAYRFNRDDVLDFFYAQRVLNELSSDFSLYNN